MGETNWAGNYTYAAARIHRPASVDELAELVAGAERIRVLGSRHAFNDIADADELVSLDGLPAAIEVGDDWVACGGAVRYGELAEALHPHGRALHNLASLPHIAVAGAIATATHGSGTGNLATAVRALELVTSSGDAGGASARRSGLRRRGRRTGRSGGRDAGHAGHPSGARNGPESVRTVAVGGPGRMF